MSGYFFSKRALRKSAYCAQRFARRVLCFLAIKSAVIRASRADLTVSEHEVVPPRESTHRWLPVETRVRSRAIVVLQPARQDPAAIGRGIVRPPVRPLAQR